LIAGARSSQAFKLASKPHFGQLQPRLVHQQLRLALEGANLRAPGLRQPGVATMLERIFVAGGRAGPPIWAPVRTEIPVFRHR